MSFNELLERGTADFPVELYHVDKHDSRYEMVSHWHGDFEIIRILEGELNVRLSNNAINAKAGDIIFVSPELIHSGTPTECIYECLDFSLTYLSVNCGGCRYFFEGVMHGEYTIKEHIKGNDVVFHSVVNEIFDTMKNRSKGYKFKVIGGLYRMFGEIIDKHYYSDVVSVPEPTADKSMLKLKAVLSFMRGNYDKQITLKNMAESVGMSPKYFCYFFKGMTQKSPIEYLNTYRIEQASRMLINSNKSVTEIAYSCGFNDLSYFIKTFKVYKGITPAKFRKSE